MPAAVGQCRVGSGWNRLSGCHSGQRAHLGAILEKPTWEHNGPKSSLGRKLDGRAAHFIYQQNDATHRAHKGTGTVCVIMGTVPQLRLTHWLVTALPKALTAALGEQSCASWYMGYLGLGLIPNPLKSMKRHLLGYGNIFYRELLKKLLETVFHVSKLSECPWSVKYKSLWQQMAPVNQKDMKDSLSGVAVHLHPQCQFCARDSAPDSHFITSHSQSLGLLTGHTCSPPPHRSGGSLI